MGSGGSKTSGGGAPKPSPTKPSTGFVRDVPHAVRMAVRVALELADASGEVPGGMPALQAALGHDTARGTRMVVAGAESWGLMRREGPVGHGPRRLFVVVARNNRSAPDGFRSEPRSCDNCGRPTTGRWCTLCQPSFRRDREWRMLAVAMLVAGKTPPAIAAAVGQNLYPTPGDGPLTGVVAFLLGEVPKLVPPEWREGYLNIVGAEVERTSSVLTSRTRQRRHRRKVAAHP